MGLLLTVAYDGTDYCGWQEQAVGVPTVCAVLKAAAEEVLGCPIKILGASRTDAGVHAAGQRAHIIPEKPSRVPIHKLAKVFNAFLPDDIAITAALEVSDDFHPIKDAVSKTYSYKIFNHPHRNPLIGRFSAHESSPLDLEAMQAACRHFIGQHDFASFCATGSSATTTVRRVNFLDITCENNLLDIKINGNGFLYNMVRIIAGTLLEVGMGKILPEYIPDIIAAKDRTKAGKTMPAQGLTLLEVFYRY